MNKNNQNNKQKDNFQEKELKNIFIALFYFLGITFTILVNYRIIYILLLFSMPKIIKEIKELKNKKNSLKVFLPRKEVVPILKKEQTLKPVQAKTIEKKPIPSHVSYPIPSNNQELSLVRKRVKH